MIAASILVSIPNFIISRIHWKLAPILHNTVLDADVDLNKADWTTGFAPALGIFGVGFGLWWFDTAAAIFISLGMVSDGFKDLHGCLAGLFDARASTTKSKQPHQLTADVYESLTRLDWVEEAEVLMRDQGQVIHTEVFVVPNEGNMPSLEELDNLCRELSALDWKLHDLVLVPVVELPEQFLPQVNEIQE